MILYIHIWHKRRRSTFANNIIKDIVAFRCLSWLTVTACCTLVLFLYDKRASLLWGKKLHDIILLRSAQIVPHSLDTFINDEFYLLGKLKTQVSCCWFLAPPSVTHVMCHGASTQTRSSVFIWGKSLFFCCNHATYFSNILTNCEPVVIWVCKNKHFPPFW